MIDDYISIEKTEKDNGVVIKKEGDEYTINQLETEKLRKTK